MLREPPALAVRILNWFPYLRQNPALEGDLLELFGAGKSQAWYWRQTLAIVAAGMLRNLHEFREYLAAMCIGWAAQTAIVLCLVHAGLPGENHGVLAVGSALLLWLAPFFLIDYLRQKVVGPTSWSLQLLIRYDWATRLRRAPILMLVAGYSFATSLAVYYLLARFVHLSYVSWIAAEIGAILSEVLLAVARPDWKHGRA
jgi:hypothetical protein